MEQKNKNGFPDKQDVTNSKSKGSKKLQTAAKTGGIVAKTLSVFVGKIITYTLNIVLTVLLIGIITGSAVACALVVYIKNYVDPTYDIVDLNADSSLTTSIYYQEKQENGSVEWVEWKDERIYGSENRMWVPYDQIPEDLINAFISVEDKRFFNHPGVDIRRTVGAVIGFVTGTDSYGGSTITQQLIKNVTGEDDVTIQRKIQEILRALDLESKRSKEEILEMYLNTIYLSNSCYGIASASYEFFGKEVSDLTLVECAALASIPKNPTRYDPVARPEENQKRRETVLLTMYENENIARAYTLEEIRAAKQEELVLTKGISDRETSKVHSWFVDTVIFDVVADLQATYHYDEQTAKKLLYSGGLEIYITIDREIQDILDSIYQNSDMFPSHGTGVQVESAMTIIDQSTGNIVGIIGGRGVKDTPLGFNRATMAKRQPGSAIKPLASYSIALEKGLINYSSVLDDTPFETDVEKKSVWPNNWNNVFDGLQTISLAVRDSKNTIAVKVLDMIGTRNSYNFLVDRYRLSTLVEADVNYAPLGLGGLTNGIYNREITAAYAAIANNGVFNKSKTYTKVYNSTGNVILDNTVSGTDIILSEDTCSVMTKLLQEVVNQGTGTKITLRNKIDCAGKTGTTQNDNDLYFCGYTPYYTASCWVGYDIARSLTNFTSGQTAVTPALYIWDQVMTRVHEDILANGNVRSFSDTLTKNLVTRTYCKDSGLLAGPYCTLDCRGNRTATGFYTKATVPTETCNRHVMVSFCSISGLIAGANCAATHQKALVSIRREFDLNIIVRDSQYTYQVVPEGTPYPKNTWDSHYLRTYTEGIYPGYTSTLWQANAFCAAHNPELCT